MESLRLVPQGRAGHYSLHPKACEDLEQKTPADLGEHGHPRDTAVCGVEGGYSILQGGPMWW